MVFRLMFTVFASIGFAFMGCLVGRTWVQTNIDAVLAGSSCLVENTGLFSELKNKSTFSCVWKRTTSPTLKSDLEDLIVGQPQAIEVVSDAVLNWKRTKPLLIVYFGYESSGKRSLALSLDSLLIDPRSCADTATTTTVFHIQGSSISSQSDYFCLLPRLERHFLSHPWGSMILWENVDQSHRGSVTFLVHYLAKNPNVILYMTTHGDLLSISEVEAFISSVFFHGNIAVFNPHSPVTLKEMVVNEVHKSKRAQITGAAIEVLLGKVNYTLFDNGEMCVMLPSGQSFPLQKVRSKLAAAANLSSSVLLYAPGEDVDDMECCNAKQLFPMESSTALGLLASGGTCKKNAECLKIAV